MNKLTAFFSVLKAGNELANAQTWKNRQALVAALVALGGAGLAIASAFGYRLDVSSDDLVAIAGGLASVIGLFNGYLSIATSARVGLPGAASNEPASDGSGGTEASAGGATTTTGVSNDTGL